MFDTGLMKIYQRTQTVNDGQMPVESLQLKDAAYFGDRNISAARTYEAAGVDRRIDRLVRVPFDTWVQVDWIVVIGRQQYRVDVASDVIIGYNTRAKELTLVKLEDYYDIPAAQTVPSRQDTV